MADLVPLNNGTHIPILGFGTADDKSYTLEQKKMAVSDALEIGYRHFDTASIYNSEQALGEALNDAFKAGKIKRDDVFVTSKLWCADVDDALTAIKKSLSTLQFDYLDLYLIHWPLKFRRDVGNYEPLDIKKTWQAMEKCVHLGLTKSIGVSNFSSKKVEELLSYAEIPPAVNQVEMHPRWQQKRLLKTCSKADIRVSAWSPLGAPQTRWGSVAVIDHPITKEIAAKHGKTPAQVLIRWALDQGVIALPKSYNKERMTANFQVFGWHLTDEDYEKFGSLEQQKNMSGPFLADGSNYKSKELWDGEE